MRALIGRIGVGALLCACAGTKNQSAATGGRASTALGGSSTSGSAAWGGAPLGGANGQGGFVAGSNSGGALANAGGNASNGGSSSANGGAVVAIGGTAGAPVGGSASGGAAPGGSTGSPEPSPSGAVQAPAYNGQRGRAFNDGWKFNLGDTNGAEKPSFDDSSWRALTLPHDWSIELAFNSNSKAGGSGGYLDGGIGWYRKSFTLDSAAANRRVLVAFDGVYMNSQVWINGTSLGTRPYGYSTFEYDLTPYMKFDGSKNVIAVKVNNEQPNSRFYSGSGIYRNVWLTQLDAVHVATSGVFVTTPEISDTSATVALSTDVENKGSGAASVVVATTIFDAAGATVVSNESAATMVASGATSNVAQSLQVPQPKLWSVASPYLYRVQVEVKLGGAVVDRYLTSLGIRKAGFDSKTGFSLNGKSFKLQGVNMHHDLGALGAAVNYRAIERQVEILKTMGVNAIRTSHNPPAPELLDVADRLGMLILDEAFDTWTQTKTANDYALYFNDWAQRDIQDMVRRDRNHPSVILYSIGNEVYGATAAIAKNLRDWVLAVDKTRAITWASNKMSGPHYTSVDHDIAALLDVAGYNYAPYAGDYDADHTANPGWKLLGTETSAALRSRGIYHTPAGTVTKATSSSRSDKQCSSYDNETTNFGDTAEVSYAYDASRPFALGSFIWAGFDYIGEPTPYGWPAKSSYYGIIDTAGFSKDVYYFYKSRWTSEPVVHILPHWNWSAGTTVTVYVYNNCDSVELFLNDASQGSKSFAGSALHSEWSLPWSSGTLRADCKKGGSVVASDTVKTAAAAAKVALSVDRSRIRADGRDLVFVTADVQDANGIIVPTAENSMSFSVSGPGELVGVDNGNPIDTSSYKGSSKKAFSGKALAIVRSTGAAGSIVVKASSTGLSSEPVTVAAQ